MEKTFESDRMVNINNKEILGLFLSNYLYQTNHQFVEIPKPMCKKLGYNRVQYSNTPVLQHSGIWNNEGKDDA